MGKRSTLGGWLALVSCVAYFGFPSASAQPAEESAKPPSTTAISAAFVQSQLDGLEDSKLDDETKSRVKQLYKRTLDVDLKARNDHAAAAARFQQMIDDYEQALQEAMQSLARPEPVEPSEPTGITLDELEKKLEQASSAWTAAKQEKDELDAEAGRRQSRRVAIPELRKKATARLADLKQQLAIPAPADRAAELTAARRTQLQAEIQARESELARYRKEIEAYDTTPELLRAQRDLAARKAARVEQRVNQLNALVSARKQQQAEQSARRERLELARTDPSLQVLAKENLELAVQVQNRVRQVDQLKADILATTKKLESLEKQARDARQRVKKIGLTEAMGMLLRKHRARLPDSDPILRRIRERGDEIRTAEAELIDLDARRSTLAVMDRRVNATIAGLDAKPENMSADALRLTVQELLERRRDLLDALIRSEDEYFEALVTLNSTEQKLTEVLDSFRGFIDERILWVRSTGVIRWKDFANSIPALGWIVRPANWREVRTALQGDMQDRPLVYVLFAALLVISLLLRPRLLRRLVATGALAAAEDCRRYRPTVESFCITLALALIWAIVPYFLSWRLSVADSSSEFVRGLQIGLTRISEVFYATGLLVYACRPQGLGDSHFRWSEAVRSLLGRRVVVLIPLLLPAALTFSLCFNQSNPDYSNSLGRICFAAVLLVISIFTHVVITTLRKSKHRSSGPRQIKFAYSTPVMWYIVGTVIPSALAVLAIAGYLFTASVLASNLRATSILLLELTIIGAMSQRWFLVARRKMAARQAAREAQPAAGVSNAGTGNAGRPAPSVDLTSLDRQSRQLLRMAVIALAVVGMWYIWRGALPALAVMEQVELWSVGSGAEAREITLRHLALAILSLGVTIMAVRDLPSMLELLLLNRLPFDFGARYALMTVVRYGVLIVGFVCAFNTMGIRWSQYQWLVAAATVGLGFGLQEIFANFVSGLILLAERPIRVGDVVTVGNVTGIVSKISMRSTIVNNWDRQEFIVPNKDFVTGKVLNWTLSNSINRIVIHVPVAPAANTDHVREVLMNVAREHPLITDDPPPIVTFDQFTDGTHRFTVRCYLPDMDNRLGTIHDLHSSIHRALVAEGIDIPAPRHQIYISTADESDILGTREKPQQEIESGRSA